MSTPSDRPGLRAAVLAAGAAAVYLALDSGRAPFGAVPLLVGLVYLVAAVAGGRGGSLWAPGCVVTGWGLANLALTDPLFAELRLPESAAHMIGMGLGVLALAGLLRAGVRTSLASAGTAVLLSGVLFALQRGQGVEALNRPWGYAALLALYAVGELVTVQVQRRR